ncbi:MAG: hypothetical protein AAF065_01985 [Verrucomicrobiota bacterium]
MKWLNRPLKVGKLRVSTMDLVSSVAAALGYGGWAVFVNYEVSPMSGWRAGCVQGSYAFCSTLFLTIAIRKIYYLGGSGKRGRLIAFAVGIVIIISLPATLNLIAQTPNVIMTILPGILIGSVYVGMFAYLLE